MVARATAAEISQPYGVVVDAYGNLFFSDTGNKRIRMVNTLGIITTIAGDGIYGYTGDGGPATAAEVEYLLGINLDASSNLYMADENAGVIRKVTNAASANIEQFTSNHEQVSVYPNPASTSLQVVLAGNTENTELKVVNMLGKKFMPPTPFGKLRVLLIL